MNAQSWYSYKEEQSREQKVSRRQTPASGRKIESEHVEPLNDERTIVRVLEIRYLFLFRMKTDFRDAKVQNVNAYGNTYS